MKPSAFLLFCRSLSCLSSVILLSAGGYAADINWTGATGGTWSTGTNWGGGLPPGANDVATFTTVANPVTINLGGAQVVMGLATPNTALANVFTILAGGTDTTLTIGASGISHLRGGLTIGSGTAGQKVDVLLSDTQTWDSSRDAGSGSAQALFINNNVSLQGNLGARTLTLTGLNTGSYVNGVISNATGSTLNIVKTGTGIWSLNGANTYSGTTQVNEGTLRLGEAGTISPTQISVATGATLTLKLEATAGGAGFSDTEVATYRSGVNFAAGSVFGLDTSNGSASYSASLNGINFAKTGGSNLVLTGTSAPTGTSVREGGLILSNSSTLTGPITVANSASLIARVGGAGFTSAEILALRSSAVYQGTSYFGISTANGDYSFNDILPNISGGDGVTVRFSKAEANTLFLTAQNTYNSGTQISGGTLSISDIKNGGQISQIGMSGNVVNGIILAGGRLQYTGAGATTDRLFNLTGSSAIESSGTGALVFNNTGSIATENNVTRTLNLTGYNRDDNRLGLNLINGTSGTTSVVKNGFGKWILSGTNTFTGGIVVRGGTLVLDYTGGKTPVAATSSVTTQGGVTHFMGSGVTNIGTLNLSDNENGMGILKVSGGMNLTAATLNSKNGQRSVLLDLSGSGNQLSFTALSADTIRSTGGLLLTNKNRANLIVRANDGTYGFAAAAADTNSSVQKLSGQTILSPGSTFAATSTTANYLIGAGDYSTNATVSFLTLTFDSSAGAINLNFNTGHNINPSGDGRGLLFTGSNNVNFTGTGGSLSQSTWLHNYLDDSAQLNISNPLGNNYLIIGGTGFTNFTGSSLAANHFVLNGGLFRAASALNLTGTYRINDSVFEVGASLSNNGAIDLNQTADKFQLIGDSGLSAYGADRTASLGTDVVWGATNGVGSFLVNAAGEDGDHAFRLSSTRSNATIDFKSNINLNGKMRTVDVANGSANVDARLSGNLTGSGIASRLAKTGLGTLELTGTNTYSGMTRVEKGKLRVGGGGLTATTSIHVQNSTLELAAANVINDSADIILENATFNTASAAETLGRLTLIGDNKLDLVGLGNIIRMADSSSLVWSSSLSIYNWNGNAGGGGEDQFFIGTTNGGVTTDQLSKIFFVNPTVDGISHTGTFGSSILGTGEIVAAIPEPSAAAFALLASASLLVRRRRLNA